MIIGSHDISNHSKVFIIAEAGVNHNGSVETAKRLVDAACDANADAIKFQMFKSDMLVTRIAELVEYQKKNARYRTQKEMLAQYELNQAQFLDIKSYCVQKKIMFLCTPFDITSASILHDVGVEAFKIGSGDLTYYPLLNYIASLQKPILLSTGMATLGEIEATIQSLPKSTEIALFHCTSAYPAPIEDVHLRAINTLSNAFQKPIGYSDHTTGIEIPIAAVSLGYKLIEKHLTLDRGMEGPDHKASIEPHEFKNMVKCIRNVEKALGSSVKQRAPSEENAVLKVRRGLYISGDKPAGHQIVSKDLHCLRPQLGIPSSSFEQVLGRKLQRDKRANEPLFWNELD